MRNTMRKYGTEGQKLTIHSMIRNEIHRDTGNYIFPFHQHSDFLEISLILSGTEGIDYEHKTYHAHAGDLVIKNAGTLHQEYAEGDEPLEELSLGLSGVSVDGLPDNCLLYEGLSPVISAGDDMDILEALFHFIHRMYEKSVSKYADLIQLNIQDFFFIVLDHAQQRNNEAVEKNKMSDLIRNVLDYINENYAEPIGLESIARDFFVSPYYLARQFKSETGTSVNQYIQNRRLGEAEKRLVFEDTSIKEIAADCGYSTLKYFYSAFKTKTGHTPNEFRSIMKENQSM